VRASGQQESVDKKLTSDSDSGSRIGKIESDLAKISTNMYKQCEELKRLISQKQRTTHELSNYSKGANKPAVAVPHQSEKMVTPRNEKPTPPITTSQPVTNTYSNMQRGPPSYPISCWHCGVVGHLSRNCPMKVQGTTYSSPSDNFANRGSKQQDQANVYIRLILYGKEVFCLVDSGCETTLIPKTLIDSFGDIEVWSSTKQVWAANNTEIEIYGEAYLPFVLNERCIWTPALISDDVEEVMLGADWLKENRCVWDFGTGNLSINGCPAVTLTQKGYNRCRRVMVREPVEIPPRSQVVIPARMTIQSTKKPSNDVMIETREVKQGVYVGRTLLPNDRNRFNICVANTTRRPQLLAAGAVIGRPVAVTTCEDERTIASSTPLSVDKSEARSQVLTSVMETLPTELADDQQQRVRDLLTEYGDIFSTGTFDMGRTSLVEHSIDTDGHRPIRQALRRHPRAHLDEIDKQVDGLLENGLIEPAASPWASNIVLVQKKDGSFRLCVDYRRLNSVTYQDSYPLPHIDTCLSSMNGAIWFTTLDLRSGYHNIPIRESDKDKTAFITRRGCFRYKVMPFGLTCAPSVFQRLMDLVLCGLTYETCLVYLDDIIVFSKDFDTHLLRLRKIFDRLRGANLKLHGKKCSFFRQRVDFLGHVLTKAGIEVQPEKIEAVQNWPTPQNLTELRSFIGLCSYYRRFIAGFANVASPLYLLTQKNAPFRWDTEQQQAFQALKTKLVSAPILGMPQDEGAFFLDTDASDRGLGAVLSQEQNGQEVVIAYASRTLSRPERNYDVTRRELLAVVYGLKSYRQYLLGRHFIIRTDHSALQYLRRTPEPIGQQARWQTYIEQFTFTIRHRAGTQHRNADALSRRPQSDSEGEASADIYYAKRTTVQVEREDEPSNENSESGPTAESMAELQQQDSDIGPILRKRIEQNNQPRPEEFITESAATKDLWGQWNSLVIVNGVLYRKANRYRQQTSVLQLVVPAVKRKEFIARCHKGMTGGHRAFRATLDQVRRRGYWIRWRKDVERYCRQCENCSRYHRGNLPRIGPLQPMLTGSDENSVTDNNRPNEQSQRLTSEIRSSVSGNSDNETSVLPDEMAIAGVPTSASQLRTRPRRTLRRPARYL